MILTYAALSASLSRIFCGLRPPWTIPCSCAALRPAQTCSNFSKIQKNQRYYALEFGAKGQDGTAGTSGSSLPSRNGHKNQRITIKDFLSINTFVLRDDRRQAARVRRPLDRLKFSSEFRGHFLARFCVPNYK